MMTKGIIFDGDDTLWETMPLYTDAKQRFFNLMAHEGFSFDDVERTFEQIDHDNVARYGFSRQRFPQSMVETYDAFCKAALKPIKKEVAEIATGIGNSVFDAPIRAIDQASHVLASLREYFRLILATKGDSSIQRRRVAEAGLEDYFDAIHLLEEKTPDVFSSLIRENEIDTESSWAVGNSLRSDINPALKAGLRAIWIPYETWGYEQQNVEHSERLFVCHKLKEVPELILRKGE